MEPHFRSRLLGCWLGALVGVACGCSAFAAGPDHARSSTGDAGPDGGGVPVDAGADGGPPAPLEGVRDDGSVGSAPEPTGTVAGLCPMPLVPAEAVASTPRADVNLELLALHLDADRVVASQDTYDRVVADAGKIRQLAPELADVQYFAPEGGTTLDLTFDEATSRLINAGQYSAWDCLNDFYGLVTREVFPLRLMASPEFVVVRLTLKGTYNLRVLAGLYAELPGVESAGPATGGGDGPTICARRDGTTLEYVVDRAGGDCPAGCNTHDARLFTSTAPGVIEVGDAWTSPPGGAQPDWFSRVCSR